MILMMVSIIVTSMRVLQECNKKKKEDKVLLYRQHIQEYVHIEGGLLE